jgi:hypothetical protein
MVWIMRVDHEHDVDEDDLSDDHAEDDVDSDAPVN